MAKLKAHKIVAKLKRILETPDSDLTSKRVYTRAVCEDRKILECCTVHWREDQKYSTQQYHSYEYKVKGTLKSDVTPAQHIEHLQARGWIML